MMFGGREAALEDRVRMLEGLLQLSRQREEQIRDRALSYAIGVAERGSGSGVVTEYANAFLAFLKAG